MEKNDSARYGNNCIRYEHLDGYPIPKTSDSCCGCKYSFAPELFDGGCNHPDFIQEHLTVSKKRHFDSVLRKVNEAYLNGHPPNAEYR